MKILKNVALYIALTMVSIVAIAFTFIEWRALFAGDWQLFNNPAMQGASYFFRGFYFFLIFTLCVFIVLFKIAHKKICIILFASAVSLFFGAVLSLLFYELIVSLGIMAITAILVTITSIGFFSKEEDTCPCGK